MNAYRTLAYDGDFGSSSHTITYRTVSCMTESSDIAGGVDVHSRILVASILNGERYETRDFNASARGYLELGEWFLENDCPRVLFEATGVYWYQLFLVLSGMLEVVVANPWHIKCIPGAKTDKRDSRWLALVCQKRLANPSRVFTGDYHEFRESTRQRRTLVKMRTALKNRVHRSLQLCGIKLANVFTDCFGKKGKIILEAMLQGEPLDDILKDKKLKLTKEKKQGLREAIQDKLDPVSILGIERNLRMIEYLDEQIKISEAEIARKGNPWKKELRILSSIPGVGTLSAHLILSEIGDIQDFKTGDQLASYYGLAPTVYQSAGKNHTGHITKHGSPHMRWILGQVAHIIAKMKDNKLGEFYQKKKEQKGSGIAAVATARKLLCLIHHLLINNEPYQENNQTKKKRTTKLPEIQATLDLNQALKIVEKAGYIVNKPDKPKPKRKSLPSG